jgi:CDP-diacylglycerol--glycerol-3-phosphate 3-phosphatidyltransferase
MRRLPEEGPMSLKQEINLHVRHITGNLVAKTLGKTSISASALTIIGFVITTSSIWLLAGGQLFWAGCVILFASLFDMLDGALARAKGQVSQFGAFLDSTLDRVSEVFIFLGFFFYYQRTMGGFPVQELTLIFLSVTGSLLVSYVRARAEAVGFECKVGLMERPERIIVIVLGLLINQVTLSLWLLAVLTYVTVFQRLFHVLRQARQFDTRTYIRK